MEKYMRINLKDVLLVMLLSTLIGILYLKIDATKCTCVEKIELRTHNISDSH